MQQDYIFLGFIDTSWYNPSIFGLIDSKSSSTSVAFNTFVSFLQYEN